MKNFFKKIGKISALIAASFLLFGTLACSSDGLPPELSGNGTDDGAKGTFTDGALTTERASKKLTTATAAGKITLSKNGGTAETKATIAAAFEEITNNAAENDSYVITLAPGKYAEDGLKLKNLKGTNTVTIKGSGTAQYGMDVLIYGQGSDMTQESSRSLLSFEGAGTVILENLTLQNSHGTTSGTAQAETLGVSNSAFSGKLAVYNSAFLSGQDTICTEGKAWFYKCYIEGDVDFLWMEKYSSKVALYEECVIRAVNIRKTNSGGAVTAYYTAPRLEVSNTVGKGVVIWNSTLEAEDGLKDVYLGRNPWDKETDEKKKADNGGTYPANYPAFESFYENVAIVGTKYYGKALNEAIWKGSGAHGTANQQFVGFKTDDHFPASSNASTNGAARLTSAQVEAEYSSRNAILNRVYNILGEEFETESEPWDVSAIATEFDAGDSGELPTDDDGETVTVTWDWVAEGVTYSTDKSSWATTAITSGYIKGDNDDIVAEATGGEFKINTGNNPYGTFNEGATMKIPVSAKSVVTVTAWNYTIAANYVLGGKTLPAISGKSNSAEASIVAPRAGYIELTSTADSSYIKTITVTKLNPNDDFSKDAIDFANETETIPNNNDTLGLVAVTGSTKSNDTSVVEVTSVTSSGIVITAKGAGTTTITAGDGTNTATISVTVGKYGLISYNVTEKYLSEYSDDPTTVVWDWKVKTSDNNLNIKYYTDSTFKESANQIGTGSGDGSEGYIIGSEQGVAIYVAKTAANKVQNNGTDGVELAKDTELYIPVCTDSVLTVTAYKGTSYFPNVKLTDTAMSVVSQAFTVDKNGYVKLTASNKTYLYRISVTNVKPKTVNDLLATAKSNIATASATAKNSTALKAVTTTNTTGSAAQLVGSSVAVSAGYVYLDKEFSSGSKVRIEVTVDADTTTTNGDNLAVGFINKIADIADANTKTGVYTYYNGMGYATNHITGGAQASWNSGSVDNTLLPHTYVCEYTFAESNGALACSVKHSDNTSVTKTYNAGIKSGYAIFGTSKSNGDIETVVISLVNVYLNDTLVYSSKTDTLSN